jgi:hypothetical protein
MMSAPSTQASLAGAACGSQAAPTNVSAGWSPPEEEEELTAGR